MIEPIEKEIDGKIFILSKVPARAARKIFTQYVVSATPKLGDYNTNEALMDKLLSYVGVPIAGASVPMMLSTPALIDNHVNSWETLIKIEWAMIEYNCSFFQNGRISTFFGDIAQKVPLWISKILTDLLAQFVKADKPSSESSTPSIV